MAVWPPRTSAGCCPARILPSISPSRPNCSCSTRTICAPSTAGNLDEVRRIAVGYDSGNGVLAAFDIAADGSTRLRWRRDQNHACHLLLFADTGELVTNDHDIDRMADQFVVLDIETGDEQLRVDAGSPLQSVLFPSVGWDRDVYDCSFAAVSRLAARPS